MTFQYLPITSTIIALPATTASIRSPFLDLYLFVDAFKVITCRKPMPAGGSFPFQFPVFFSIEFGRQLATKSTLVANSPDVLSGSQLDHNFAFFIEFFLGRICEHFVGFANHLEPRRLQQQSISMATITAANVTTS